MSCEIHLRQRCIENYINVASCSVIVLDCKDNKVITLYTEDHKQ